MPGAGVVVAPVVADAGNDGVAVEADAGSTVTVNAAAVKARDRLLRMRCPPVGGFTGTRTSLLIGNGRHIGPADRPGPDRGRGAG
ncbi:hypothetical protein GCM10010372_05140 [Streptomyces tauricus]|nr:hypothetical protein GCM10010372_05140 [Streptomyces tauricus]